MTVHEAAAQGYAGASAQYERGRPDYPATVGEWLKAELGLAPGQAVLDLGAGTGKFTQLLLQTGAAVSAVEPVDAMRERLAAKLPKASVLAGTAEAIPLAEASMDWVVCAQAFHWFANDQALREIHRVLRPGGRLIMVWNVRDESVDWVAAITALIAPHEAGVPRFHTGRWRQPFENGQTLFTPPQQVQFEHQHIGCFEEVIVDRILSVSFIAALPEAERESLASRLRELRASYAALRDAQIVFPYKTEVWLSAVNPARR